MVNALRTDSLPTQGSAETGGVVPKMEADDSGKDVATAAPFDGDEPPLDVIFADESSGSASDPEIQRSHSDGSSIEDEITDGKPLPSLDALVARLPAEVRETMETLFRARFTKVTRVPRSALNARAHDDSGAK